MNYITLNLRGTIFTVEHDFINANLKPSSPLLQLNESSKYYQIERKEFYFNKSPVVFDAVLDYLDTGSLHAPGNVCTAKFQREMDFWGVPHSKIEKCCWNVFYRTQEDVATLEKLLDHIKVDKSTGSAPPIAHADDNCCSKAHIYSVLTDYTTTCGKIWYGILCTIILLSTFLFVMISVPAFRVPVDNTKNYTFSETSNTAFMYYTTKPHPAVVILDTACNVIFTVDWLIRFFCAPNKKSFIKGFLPIVELISWVFQWMGVVMEIKRDSFSAEGLYPVIFAFSSIYCIRVLRVFRIISHNVGVRVLVLSLKSSARELFLLAVGFGCVAIIFGILLYMAELGTDTDVTLPNVLVSIWWAVVTMTTVGYGDYYPTTPQGYCIGCCCALTGILLIALPMAVTSSNFSDFYTFNKYRERYLKSIDNKSNCETKL